METSAHPEVGMLLIGAAPAQTICSGTLIGRDVVLTAAHCVTGRVPADITFKRGAGPVFDAALASVASAIVIHPSYDPKAGSLFHTPDLALVKLARRATTPAAVLDLSGASAGDDLEIVGFGRDESDGKSGQKRTGTMNVLAAYEILRPPTAIGFGFEDGLLESLPTTADQIICPGDSGGPAFRQGALAGVASFIRFPEGTPAAIACTSAELGYHTSVAAFASFIQETAARLDPPGACAGNDDSKFATLGGGCKDRVSGRVWSKWAAARNRTNAVSYCNNLVEGGFDNWRLPTRPELVAAASHAAGTHLKDAGTSNYWSSTLSGTSGQSVRLDTGVARTEATTVLRPVYCVR